MHQPHPDQHNMQQQIQYTNPQYQQLQQPIMLCPVQYVYEQLVPDEQGQPNPAQPYQSQAYLMNVQNTPPWAQNRPSMIYMQQMTMQPQPYMQQVVQNPMYNYQYQPMIVQEQIRQIVPSYVNQNVMNQQNVQSVHQMMNQNQIMQTQNQQMIQNVQSQNPQLMQNVQNQGIMNSNIIQNPIRFVEKRETPILASMLNVRKPLTQNELVSIIRPQYQNMRPQMIIVNPIAKHTCVHNTQKEPPPVFIEKQQDNDIQSIRSQVPEGLSVQSIKVSATALVKPNENVFQNIAQADDVQIRVNNKPKTFHRDPQTNYKRKIKELLELNNKDENEAFAKRMCPNKPDEQIFKTQVLIDTQPNTSEIQTNNRTLPIATTTVFNFKPQAEEKKLRNTVFVQARGLVDDLRVNEIQNVNYTNISNTGTNIANIMINNKNIENLNSVVVNNINLDFNKTNNEHLDIVALNNLYNENIMHWNNQSAETNVGNEIIINTIGNLEGVPMQVQIPTQNNETQVNFDNQLISEQVVQNVKLAIREKIISSKEVEVVKENNRQDDVKSTTSSNNKVTTMVNKNTVQNEVELTQNVSTENSSTTNKQLKKEPKPRKSKKNKVAVTDMTINKATITNVPQIANTEISNNSNDQSKVNLLKNLEDEFINTSATTDMSNNNIIVSSNANHNKSNNNVTKNDIPSDANHNKSDVTNVKMTDVAEEIEKKENKKLKKTSKSPKTDKIDKKNENKSKVTKDKAKIDKKKINTKVFEKEPAAVYVLTHVLDGHIIQESNVPFLVQKPSMTPTKEKPILKEKRVEINEQTEVYEDSIRVETEENTVKESIPVETKDNVEDLVENNVDTVKASTTVDTEVNEASIRVETENNIKTSIRVETDKNIGESIRTEKENNIEDSIRVETKVIEARIPVEAEVSSNTNTENHTVDERNKPKYDKPDTSVADEDSPFKDLKKSVLGAWTISEVTSYLMKHANWRDTAIKLADQEIDGESLLLARRDQLLQIDICEEHAQEISEFVDQLQ